MFTNLLQLVHFKKLLFWPERTAQTLIVRVSEPHTYDVELRHATPLS
jgi:hypothetical protein